MNKTDLETRSNTGDVAQADIALLLAQAEQDRARIARLIHDGLAQKLTVAGMELSLWKSELQTGPAISAASVEAKISILSDLVSGSIADARDVNAALYPRILETFGIGAAIESVVGRCAKRLGIQCRFAPEKEGMGIDDTIGIQLVRVAELILESIHVPKASVMTAEVSRRGPNVELSLHCDEWKITVPAEAAARVHVFGGTISKEKGQGALVVSLPAIFEFPADSGLRS